MSELDLFNAAIKLTGDQRSAFLVAACGQDSTLRKQVEDLLRAHDESGGLLPRHTNRDLAATQALSNQAQPGTIIAGRYKLLEAIGEGGMGTVWVAEQSQPVKRKVALKLIKAGMDSKSVLARFEAERQALAVMDHPNIAKVLDGGITESGRPYFVMEYVKGVPITEYCDATRMSVPDRLQLFAQVCQAVQHAHQKGIIHRDLKPSNILVAPYDDKPVPKVIDFGLAKAINQSLTEKTLHTAHDMVLGTPLYMSPEQAQLNNIDVDTRSDIYSLGVLLYELLTGTTPLEKQRFKEAAWDEVRRIIREEEPPRPSLRLSSAQTLPSLAAGRHTEPAQLTKLVRGELDWIVMKALDKDRTRRYETANGFAADVSRYLAGEPVLAAPPSANYRLRKFAQKNRTVLTTAAVIAMLFVTGTAVSVWQAVRATNASIAADRSAQEARANEVKAIEERDLKDQALEAEKAARQQARDALNTMTDDVIETLFSQQPTLDETQKEFLRKVMASYESFATQSRTSEESRFLAADGKYRVAKILIVLGERPEAMAVYRDVIPELRELTKEFPTNPEYIYFLSTCLSRYGYYLLDWADRPAAEPALREALTLQETLCKNDPGNAKYLHAMASTLFNHTILFEWLKRFDDSEQAARRHLEIRKRLAAEFPENTGYLAALGNAHNQLFLCLNNSGKKQEAYSELLKGIELLENCPPNLQSSPMRQSALSLMYNNKFAQLMKTGDVNEAEKIILKAIEMKQALSDRFPSAPDYRRDLASAYSKLGSLRLRQSRDKESIESLSQAQRLLEINLQQDPRRSTDREFLRNALELRAAALIRIENFAEAIRAWNDAVKFVEPKDRTQLLARRAISLAEITDSSFQQDVQDAKKEWLAALNDPQFIDNAKLSPETRLRTAYLIVTKLNEPARAAAEVELAATTYSLDATSFYNSSCVFSLCAAATKDDTTQQQKYADRAMEMLNQAVKAGWKDPAQTGKDPDLDPLRERKDFKQLLLKLESSQPKAVEPVPSTTQESAPANP